MMGKKDKHDFSFYEKIHKNVLELFKKNGLGSDLLRHHVSEAIFYVEAKAKQNICAKKDEGVSEYIYLLRAEEIGVKIRSGLKIFLTENGGESLFTEIGQKIEKVIENLDKIADKEKVQKGVKDKIKEDIKTRRQKFKKLAELPKEYSNLLR